jgi:RHS repeat-associated protein
VNQPEYSEQVNEYYPSSHVNKGLLKTAFSPLYDGTSTDMYRTDYEYDARGNVTKMLESAAHPGEDRPEWTYTYDSEDRKLTQVDPVGHTITYMYDDQDRVVRTTFDDGSTSETLYGAAGTAQEHLVLKMKDRRNVVTDYVYDTSDRPVTVTRASATDADILDGQIDNPITDRNKKSITTYTYLDGTQIPISVAVDGSTTDTVWDYRHRLSETITYPHANKSLHTRKTYVDNDLFSTEDPYGRLNYHGYRASDGASIRYVASAFTTFSLADEAAVFALTRDQTPNAPYVVQDALLDDAGQLVLEIDGRGVQHKTEYDAAGNAVREILALGTAVETKTETDYDDAGRPVEVRLPRFFDSNDTNGFQECKTVMAYDGRGNLTTSSEAQGATESFTYTLDNKQATRVDFRGKIWTTSYAACCGQGISTKNPLGHGHITNTDHNGNVVHTAGVADVDTHTDLKDPIDVKTLEETTSRFDEMGRVIASTEWLIPQAAIDTSAVSIAGLDGVSINDGLTTQTLYDADLTDGVGLDSAAGIPVSKLGGGSYSVSLSAVLTRLAEPASNGGGNLIFAAGASGSAFVAVNAEEELSFTIVDSASRSVMSGTIEPHDGTTPNALITWNCSVYDATHSHATYGDLAETTSVSATGNTRSSRRDGAGRLLESEDAGGFTTEMSYDAAGNLTSSRDPNNIGTDCSFDELGRQTSCTDTAGHTTQTGYDLGGNITSRTDAKGKSSTTVFDARGRRISSTDRLGYATSWAYDGAGNLVGLTDAENQTTTYTYDDSGQRTSTQYPDHVAGSTIGDPGYGMVDNTYDAIGRIASIEDQQGDTIDRTYDLASRLITRTYTGHASSPLAGPANTDNFTYDRQGRTLTATKGRYGNSVSFTYDDQGRKATESLTAHSQIYTATYSYDTEGRLQAITAADGSITERAYTDRGRLASVQYIPSGGSAQSVATFSYDDGNRESSRTLGNGLTTTRAYFNDNHVQSIATPGVETLTYTYDANQNPTSESRTGVMSPYSWSTGASGFDDEDRLVSWTRTNGDSQSWNLSEVHDWDSFSVNGASQTRTHRPAHEILAVSGANIPGGSATLQHDTKGNLTQDDRGATMAWDFDNKLNSFAANGAVGLSDATYQYDALGRRVAKSVAQSGGATLTTVFTYAGDQVLAEYAKGHPVTDPDKTYVYGEYIDEPLLRVDASTGQGVEKYWLHGARQYNVMALSDESGSVVEYRCYDPYGALVRSDQSGGTLSMDESVRAFTGQYFDVENQLHHFRARMLSSSTGRFLQRDPAGYIDGASLYAAYFAPSVVDPTGLGCKVKYECYGMAKSEDSDTCVYRCRTPDPAEVQLTSNPSGNLLTCDDVEKFWEDKNILRHKIIISTPKKAGCDCPGANSVVQWIEYNKIGKGCSNSKCLKNCSNKKKLADVCNIIKSKIGKAACEATFKVGGTACTDLCNMLCHKP